MSQPQQENKKGPRRCSALRRDGQPCGAWARRAPDGHSLYDPPLCVWHARQEGGGEQHPPPRQPPAPAPEPNPDPGVDLDPGSGRAFYAPFFDADVLVALDAIHQPNSLEGEIMLARGLMRWLLADTRREGPLTGHPLERRTARLFAGTETIARLLTTERKLEIGPDGVPRPIAEALDEIGEEWGIDL